jgi:hypothetical protein
MKLVSIVDEVFENKANSIFSNKETIRIDVIAGIPFEVPNDLGKARLDASPRRYREATDEDFAFAKQYGEEQTAKLKALLAASEESGFNPEKFLSSEKNRNAEVLEGLSRPNLLSVGGVLKIDFAPNIPGKKLIALIVEKFAAVDKT